jgi:hypothetical protein
VVYTPKEIEIDLADGVEADAVAKDVETSLAAGSKVLWLIDRRGRRVGIPADKIAYVEVGADLGERRVGFSAAP